jgi:hypothetical protein
MRSWTLAAVIFLLPGAFLSIQAITLRGGGGVIVTMDSTTHRYTGSS